MKINVLTVTYGNRFKLLKQTLDAVVNETNVDKVIIVDNGSLNGSDIDNYIKTNKRQNIILIRNKDNEGSAGGFKKGIEKARENTSDYLLLLDDDNVMEKDWSRHFINALEFFPEEERGKIVFKGNRHADMKLKDLPSSKGKILTIEYISLKRIKKFIFRGRNTSGDFYPMIFMPFGAIAYGGALIPYKAIVENDLPFEPFYLYADDVEYLYRINSSGYKAYQLSRPTIYDVDQTFSDDSSHLGSFDKTVSLIKLFFITRNQYALVRMTKSQNVVSIIFNSLFGTTAKILYAFLRLGVNNFTIQRSKILIKAIYKGIVLDFENKENIEKYKGKF